MNQSKEFQGKSLDEAIQEACAYFGVPREKLEIDILNDAKGGIFGLMGMKKASIRAARVQTSDALEKMPEAGETCPPGQTAEADTGSKSAKNGKNRRTATGAAKDETKKDQKNQPSIEKKPAQSGQTEDLRTPPAKAGKDAHSRPPAKDAGSDESPREGLPEFDMEKGDRELVKKCVEEVVLRLVRPIVGEVSCEVELGGKRARVIIDCGEDAPLLIGRDGQTLASLQYLAGRIVAKRLGASVRLQIDAGRFRERQDDKLRELALSLADKARKSGRAQSTRPLTAYQRRIIHLALEGEAMVSTRSKGEGAQRRVLILPEKEQAPRTGDLPEPETTKFDGAARFPENATGDLRQASEPE